MMKDCDSIMLKKKEDLKNTFSKSKLLKDIKGRYGSWTVLYEGKKRGSSIYIKCRCDCGIEKYILFYDLIRKKSLCCPSCSITKRNTKHGQNCHDKITYEYRLWQKLKHEKQLSKDWSESFKLFFFDIGKRPSNEYWLLKKSNSMRHSTWNSYWGNKRLRLFDLGKIGKKYGQWTVLEPDLIYKKYTRWKVLCDCGVKDYVRKYALENGLSTMCRKCAGGGIKKKHGLSHKSEYTIYHNMVKRCYNTNHKDFKYYGEKGIKVCDYWLESIVNFYNDMGERPSKKHTLDRIDPNGNYEKSNCRWALQRVQVVNRNV